MTKAYLGRHVYGAAAIAFGVISLVWHDFGAPWQQIQALGNVPHREILVLIAAAVELFGGIAIQWPRTMRTGSLVLSGIFLIFAMLWVPRIIAEPLVYDRYGNFFEQLSIVSGGLIIYATGDGSDSEGTRRLAQMGYIFFGICVISFMLVHVFYMPDVVKFVPRWIPPGQRFWALATTLAFALAAVALLSGRSALLAARLLSAMIIGFGLLVWLPAPVADPHKLFSWAGNAQNLAIAGAAWIVADFLSQNRSRLKACRKSAQPVLRHGPLEKKRPVAERSESFES
ncbi:MAG: hypothetical protein J2P13_00700 [Acidobacteria bacterium]|nr:hypothetical protein [Acidobacteriota bacterium]